MSVVSPKFTKFRTVLAIAGTVLLSFVAVTLGQGQVSADPATAVGEFTRLNAITIKATCGGQTCYYVADEFPTWGPTFYRSGTLPTDLCSDRLYRDPNRGWKRATVAKQAGACSTSTTWEALAQSTSEGLDEGGAGVYWYQESDGTLHTVTGGDRTWKLVEGSALNISGLKNAYVQPSGGTCPTVVLQYDSGSWGYVAPVSRGGDLQEDAGSVLYRQIVGTLSPERVGTSGDLGGCDASSKTIKENADNALATQIGGTSSWWESSPPRGDWIGLGTAWTNAVFKFAVTPVGMKTAVMPIVAANEDGTCNTGYTLGSAARIGDT